MQEAETHAERLQRIRQQLAGDDGVPRSANGTVGGSRGSSEPAQAGTADDSSDDGAPGRRQSGREQESAQEALAGSGSKGKRQKGKRKAEDRTQQRRPGKRQRALLREQLKAEVKVKPPKPAKKGLQTLGEAKQHKQARREKRAALQRKGVPVDGPEAVSVSKSPSSTVRKQDKPRKSQRVAS